jgi:hypothetical protein
MFLQAPSLIRAFVHGNISSALIIASNRRMLRKRANKLAKLLLSLHLTTRTRLLPIAQHTMGH